jgi:hypothetical protein
VTVNGTNLNGTTTVSFNGVASSSITVSSATQIIATVPSGATTGRISVATPQGSATSTSNFTVSVPVPAPTITGFNPSSGQVGNSVIVTGTNLTGATGFSLNGTAATFNVNSATQITAIVPAGAATGKFSVTTPGGTAMSSNSYTVTTGTSTLDLTIDGLYVTQATQDYPNPSVPLVKDRSGWVRVFAKANISNTAMPQVRVDFANGGTTNSLLITATVPSVPTAIDPNTDASWDAAVPAAWIQPGVQVTATVDPSNTIVEFDKTNNQFSATLDVRTLHPWKVTLIPVHTKDGLTGIVENASRTRNDWVDFAKKLHPVPDTIDVTVAATFNSSIAATGSPATVLTANGTNAWSQVLGEIANKRTVEGVSDRYYYGVVKVNYTSGIAGIGYIGAPAAIGWDYSSGPSVLAHEEGHNFNRPHSPCGGAGSPDPNYPYANGVIGVPGWDVFAGSPSLKNENNFTDIMGYCSTQWISDYVYKSELSYRESKSFDVISADAVNGSDPQDALLIWGRMENANVVLEPAFKVHATGITPDAGPYVWQAKDALGQVLITLPFDAPEVADLPNSSVRMFSFVVPLASDTLSKIQSLHISKDGKELTRRVATAQAFGPRALVQPQYLPNHRMQLSWNAGQSPLVMLRDAKTGEVRGFLRGGSATIEDAPDDLEVLFSDGIHGDSVTYHRTPH